MIKTLPALFALSLLATGLSGCMDGMHERKMSDRRPGSYESTETNTDARGTTTVKQSTTEVTVDENGNRRETITSKTSKDPEGLMNKTTTKTKKTTEEKY